MMKNKIYVLQEIKIMKVCFILEKRKIPIFIKWNSKVIWR